MPKRRLAPLMGEMRLNFGVRGSKVQSGRCCRPPPRSPPIAMIDGRQSRRERAPPKAPAVRPPQNAGAVRRNLMGVHQEAAQVQRQALRDRARQHHEGEREAAEHEERVDLHALGDVAALDRLVELSLRRFFGAVVALSVASAMAQPRTKVLRNAPRSSTKTPIMTPTVASRSEHADEDRGRHGEEEHLQLRHQPRQHAESEIEQDREGDERRRDLHRQRETLRRPPGWRASPRRRSTARPTGGRSV